MGAHRDPAAGAPEKTAAEAGASHSADLSPKAGASIGADAATADGGSCSAAAAQEAGACISPSVGQQADAETRAERMNLRNLNTDALAYIGDAVYELAVRQDLVRSGICRADRLHREATGYVSAAAQARAIRSIYDELTEEEQSQVRRWRNHRYHSKAKNADPMTYKWATAFEALAGYLYLCGDSQRLDWLISRARAVNDHDDDHGAQSP